MTNQSSSSLISGHWKQLPTCRVVACLLCLLFSVGLVIKADARTFLPLGRVIAGSESISQQGTDVQPLEAGNPIDRELKGGQSHSYRITVTADQFLHVVVEQRGINVVVTVLDPVGRKLTEVDRAKDKQGSESLTFITDVRGTYRLEIRPAEKNATTGRYEIQILALRTPSAEDRALEEARRLSEESRSLRQKGKYDEALPLAERALAIREKVLGPNHAVVAESLHDLAVLYIDKGNYSKAEP